MVATTQDPAVKELQRQVAELSNIVKNPTQLNQYLDIKSKDIIRNNIFNGLFDTFWQRMFYYQTYFDSIDAWGPSPSGAGAPLADYNGINFTTSNVSGNTTTIGKGAIYQAVLSYDQRSNFSTAFQLSSTTSQVFFIGVGFGADGSTLRHYGFQVTDGTLYGTCGNDTVQTLVPLITSISSAHKYYIEAHFYPTQKIDFYVLRDDQLVTQLLGTITNPPGAVSLLPAGPISDPWLRVYLKTTSAAIRVVNIAYLEYAQVRQR